MNEFFEKLKEDAENIWDGAKEAFEKEADRENESLEPFHDLFAWADGSLLALPESPEKDQKGFHTLAKMVIRDQNIVSPCDGVIQAVEPASNTLVIRTSSGQELGIKVCVGAVSFEKSAHILVDPGQKVAAGETLVHFEAPIKAKSKLFLIHPERDAGSAAALKPAARDNTVHQGDLLRSSR